jgi:hypothetical protein
MKAFVSLAVISLAFVSPTWTETYSNWLARCKSYKDVASWLNENFYCDGEDSRGQNPGKMKSPPARSAEEVVFRRKTGISLDAAQFQHLPPEHSLRWDIHIPSRLGRFLLSRLSLPPSAALRSPREAPRNRPGPPHTRIFGRTLQASGLVVLPLGKGFLQQLKPFPDVHSPFPLYLFKYFRILRGTGLARFHFGVRGGHPHTLGMRGARRGFFLFAPASQFPDVQRAHLFH